MRWWSSTRRERRSRHSVDPTDGVPEEKKLGLWTTLENCIVRPPRAEYEDVDLLGGDSKSFHVKGRRFVRSDFQVLNKEGYWLRCSHYHPEGESTAKLPCVVYLHSNSGSRCCSVEAALVVLPMGWTLLAFDFAGSGKSEGEYVTLGAREVEDVEVVIEHLRTNEMASVIGLWGRSMGAVTCLLYAERDPSVAGMVVDSPFSRLTDLMVEICETQQISLPKFMVRLGVRMLKRSIKKRARLDISSVDPLSGVGSSFVPVLFGHGQADDFIPKHHSEKLHASYAGDKNLIIFEGTHNSIRPFFFYDSASIFLSNVFEVHVAALDQDSSQGTLDSGSWRVNAECFGLRTSEAEERLLQILRSNETSSSQEHFVPRVMSPGQEADVSPSSSGSEYDVEAEMLQQAIARSLHELA